MQPWVKCYVMERDLPVFCVQNSVCRARLQIFIYARVERCLERFELSSTFWCKSEEDCVCLCYMQLSNGITYLKNKLCPQSRTPDDSTEFLPAQHMYDNELICRLSIHFIPNSLPMDIVFDMLPLFIKISKWNSFYFNFYCEILSFSKTFR